MFFWTKPLGLKVFRQTLAQAQASKILAANQGLYNGFLAAGLFWSVLHPNPETHQQLGNFFLGCVVVAGIFGALTVSRKILYVQAGPALLGILALWFG